MRGKEMVLNKAIKTDGAKEKISNNILKWFNGREQILNVISLPYNSSEIFLNTIYECINQGKKVLYITHEDENNIEIIELIKKLTDFRDYTYSKGKDEYIKSTLVLCNHVSAAKLKESFDLIIYDDIRSFPRYSNYEIIDIMKCRAKLGGKLMTYAVESVFKRGSDLVLPVSDNKLPVVEPRIITTRIDVNKDIPFVVYEYLNWSIDSDRKVIVYVPDDEKVENVYKYLSGYRKEFSKNIFYTTHNDKNKKPLFNFNKGKRGILVTDCFEDSLTDYKGVDVMVYFAEHRIFSYKKLVYFCGKAGRGEKFIRGEVIFLSSEESVDMAKAKDITRSFNEEAWKEGLLKF
jgi:late competence protein required for DNA uptake (superfamily II DNA/RNA helicase)